MRAFGRLQLGPPPRVRFLGGLGLGLGLHADGVGLRARLLDDGRRLLLGVVQVLRDLGVGLLQHLGDLVLGHPQHRAHPFAHALDALLRAHQGAHLGAQPLRAGPRVVELAGELRGLVDGRVPVGGQDPHFRVQPAQMRFDLLLVVSPAHHLEAGGGKGRNSVSGHVLTVPGASRSVLLCELLVRPRGTG